LPPLLTFNQWNELMGVICRFNGYKKSIMLQSSVLFIMMKAESLLAIIPLALMSFTMTGTPAAINSKARRLNYEYNRR
jgi:hypothetical protein